MNRMMFTVRLDPDPPVTGPRWSTTRSSAYLRRLLRRRASTGEQEPRPTTPLPRRPRTTGEGREIDADPRTADAGAEPVAVLTKAEGLIVDPEAVRGCPGGPGACWW